MITTTLIRLLQTLQVTRLHLAVPVVQRRALACVKTRARRDVHRVQAAQAVQDVQGRVRRLAQIIARDRAQDAAGALLHAEIIARDRAQDAAGVLQHAKTIARGALGLVNLRVQSHVWKIAPEIA